MGLFGKKHHLRATVKITRQNGRVETYVTDYCGTRKTPDKMQKEPDELFLNYMKIRLDGDHPVVINMYNAASCVVNVIEL